MSGNGATQMYGSEEHAGHLILQKYEVKILASYEEKIPT